MTPVTLPPGRLRLVDEAGFDRVVADEEDNRNGSQSALWRSRRRADCEITTT